MKRGEFLAVFFFCELLKWFGILYQLVWRSFFVLGAVLRLPVWCTASMIQVLFKIPEPTIVIATRWQEIIFVIVSAVCWHIRRMRSPYLAVMVCMVPKASDPSCCFLGYSGSLWRWKIALGSADLHLVQWCNASWQLAGASWTLWVYYGAKGPFVNMRINIRSRSKPYFTVGNIG